MRHLFIPFVAGVSAHASLLALVMAWQPQAITPGKLWTIAGFCLIVGLCFFVQQAHTRKGISHG